LQGKGVRNVVVVVVEVAAAAAVAVENSWERMFSAADQNMYWNSQDSLCIRHKI